MELNKSKKVLLKSRSIVCWMLYDWGHAAYPVIVLTFVFAAYFTQKIAANPIVGTALWGKTVAIAGVFIAILSPIFGSIADYGGGRKRWLALFTLITLFSAGLLWFAYPNSYSVVITLLLVGVGIVASELCMVFYNSILVFIAPPNYLGRISGWGWGLGYLGGLAALIIALFGFVKTEPAWLNIQQYEQIRICGPLVALWFFIFAVPLFIFFKDRNVAAVSITQAIKQGTKKLARTLRNLPNQKNILIYLIARMIYIDGLNTIFAFGGIYAAGTFGMDFSEVIVFGIIMNLTAGLGAIILAWADDKWGSKPTILFSLVCLIILGLCAVLVKTKILFWFAAALLCFFVGSVQSASRSLMARLIEKENATEFFGLYAFSGKVTTFLGPWVLALATEYFNSQRAGMAIVLIFFILGGGLLLQVKEPN